jgi:hypothetical protein
MMNPQEFRLFLVIAYLVLAHFGIAFNKLVDYANRYPTAKGFTSFAVVFGNAMTMLIFTLFFRDVVMPTWVTMVLLFGGFACSGAPMIIGHRMRYARELQDELKSEEDDRNAHRRLRWPKEMKVLRDGSAEEAVAGLRTVNKAMRDADQASEHLLRLKSSLLKIAALLMKAGAPIRIEEL